MAKYKVKRTLIVSANVELIVEADSPDDADKAAFEKLPSNIGTIYTDSEWSAVVEIKPPKGVKVASHKLRSIWIDHTDAGNGVKPRRIATAEDRRLVAAFAKHFCKQ